MMVQGKSDMIYMDDTNPVGPLDGGTAGGRVSADREQPIVAQRRAWLIQLEVVADVARDVRNWLNGLRGVRKPPCVLGLHFALRALDVLDGGVPVVFNTQWAGEEGA